MNIAVAPQTDALQDQAQSLATRLGLPLAGPGSTAFPLLLLVTEAGLTLLPTGKDAPGPLSVDFTQGRLAYRRKHAGGRKEDIARAVGIKGSFAPTVLDVTAGLGRDGFILAALGCTVQLVERSPVVGALLADGLIRAGLDPETAPIVRRISLEVADGLTVLQNRQSPRPDVVYLDPMYPHRTKSALVKKEMRLLRLLVGDDESSSELLAAALTVAGKRVVVKRPRLAPAVAGPAPSHSVVGKNSRFDVYLIVPRQD